MRRLIAAATLGVAGAAVALLGCASAGQPPGGPARKDPPQVLSITPESGETNVKIREATFTFDEVVSDLPSMTGATGLDQIFLVSPEDGAASVSWHRSKVTVKPRKGFRANTAYRLTMLPGLADLRGNVRKTGLSIVFSTGPTFPPFSIPGRVFDWTAGIPANGAYIEAVSHPDTNLVYITASDSAGQFDVGPLPAGTYTVRALIDANSNRKLDRNEKWDSTTVTISTTRPAIELDAIERDSVPAFFANVNVEDSTTLRVEFDKPLSPSNTLSPEMLTLQRSDSSRLQVSGVLWATTFDSLRKVRDSVRRADSLRTVDTGRARPPAPRPPTPTPTPTLPTPRRAPPPPKPRTPAPSKAIIVTLAPATPLSVGSTYRITVRGLRNLVGNTREITRTFSVPKPPPKAPPKPPADTTHRAARDTTRRVPTDTTRRVRTDTTRRVRSDTLLRLLRR